MPIRRTPKRLGSDQTPEVLRVDFRLGASTPALRQWFFERPFFGVKVIKDVLETVLTSGGGEGLDRLIDAIEKMPPGTRLKVTFEPNEAVADEPNEAVAEQAPQPTAPATPPAPATAAVMPEREAVEPTAIAAAPQEPQPPTVEVVHQPPAAVIAEQDASPPPIATSSPTPPAKTDPPPQQTAAAPSVVGGLQEIAKDVIRTRNAQALLRNDVVHK